MFLEIKGLTKKFGGLLAVNELDITVNKGEIVGLIGPNGAGKTTTFNLITSVIQPTRGRVIFNDEDITYDKPHVIAEKGIGRTFQLNPLFGEFDVLLKLAIIAIVTSFGLSYLIEIIGKALHTRQETIISLILMGTMKNFGLASGILLALFSEKAAIPSSIMTVFFLLRTLWLGFHFRKSQPSVLPQESHSAN